MKKHQKTFAFYAAIFAFVLGWWAFAFQGPEFKTDIEPVIGKGISVLRARFPAQEISFLSIDRNLLKNALAGDFNQISEFISEWDVDAQVLQSAGIVDIKRLSSKELLRSKILSRHIRACRQIANCLDLDSFPLGNAASDEAILINIAPSLAAFPREKIISNIGIMNLTTRPKNSSSKDEVSIADFSGKNLDHKKKYQRFLPQTVASASFLLSIVPPEQIVALPKYLRAQEQLFPKKLTEKIPLDIDRFHGEKLFSTKAEVAFVAEYSHPATLQALQTQGIALYTMQNLTSFEAISQELMNLGTITSHPCHAELLKIFIDAALIAIDNKQRLMVEHYSRMQIPVPTVLVLNHHHTFSMPSKATLTGKILDRLSHYNAAFIEANKDLNFNDWAATIDKEHLLLLNPSCLIIITDNEASLKNSMQSDFCLSRLSAVKQDRLFFVGEAIHHSPTQYAILAYHDIVELMENLL